MLNPYIIKTCSFQLNSPLIKYVLILYKNKFKPEIIVNIFQYTHNKCKCVYVKRFINCFDVKFKLTYNDKFNKNILMLYVNKCYPYNSIIYQAFIEEKEQLIKFQSNNHKHKNSSDNKELLYLDSTKIILEEQSKIEEEILKTYNKGEFTFDDPFIIINPYGVTPLTALVMFQTENNEVITVTIPGKDSDSTIQYTIDKPTKSHYIPIVGLYPGTSNKVILSTDSKVSQIEIKTEMLPNDFQDITIIMADKEKMEEGLTFNTAGWNGRIYPAAFDHNGDVRWYHTNKQLGNVAPFRIMSNGHILLSTPDELAKPYYMRGVWEIDILGKLYNEYLVPNGMHHEVIELPNENIMVASNHPEETVEDVIVEIDKKSGRIIKEWDLTQILPQGRRTLLWEKDDWFHMNSIFYDKKDNALIVSGRNQNAVVKLDYDTGDIIWILGNPDNWQTKYHKYLLTPEGEDFEWQWAQHTAMVNDKGNIMLYDNGNYRSNDPNNYVKAINNYSRGVEYEVDEENMTIKQIWQYGKENGSETFTPFIGDIDEESNGNILINFGGIVKDNKGIPSDDVQILYTGDGTVSSKIVELDYDTRDKIFEANISHESGIDSLYRVERVNIDQLIQ